MWRRLPVIAVVAACVAAVTAAMSGATNQLQGLLFAPAGHWVANAAVGSAFHVNGAAGTVDAQVKVPGIEPGAEVVHGESSGYVVGRSKIQVFGKSSLSVERTIAPPSDERPVAIEGVGGPYLVYRETGTVVRLGDHAVTVPAGGPLGEPVVTPDGTLWLHRLDADVLCSLAKGAERVSCPVELPRGHAGMLTVIDQQPYFVDTDDDTLSAVRGSELAEPAPVGLDVSRSARVAGNDVDGRVAVLEPEQQRLHLVPPQRPDGGEPARPVTVELPDGEYLGPVTSGSSVVLVDSEHDSVLSYGSDGVKRAEEAMLGKAGTPRLARGQDERVYVDGARGRHVMVVDHDGSVSEVPVVGSEQDGKDGRKEEPAEPEGPPADAEGPAEPDPGAGAPPPVSGPLEPDPGGTTGRDAPVDPRTRAPAPSEQAPNPDPQPPRQPEPPQEPPPDPIPASPPGMPGSLAAELQDGADGTAQVSWGPAAGNGAEVTAYHVSWQPASGSGGSITLPGTARSTVLSGLNAGATYTVSVLAQNSAGKGSPATTKLTVPADPTPTIDVTRNPVPETYNENCQAPDCAEMIVVLSNFEPDTTYHVEPHSTATDYENPGGSYTTDENGHARIKAFHFGEVGETVWITAKNESTGEVIESQRYVWPSA